MNDNSKIKRLCAMSFYTNKVQQYNCLYKKTKQGAVIKPESQKELFTLNIFPKNKQNKDKRKILR